MNRQEMGDWDHVLKEIEEERNITTVALALFCPDSDRKLFHHTMNFLSQKLDDPKKEVIFPICLPGGPAPFAYKDYLRAQYSVVKGYVEDTFAVKRFIRTIFVVTHKDCGYYKVKIKGNIPGCEPSDTMIEHNDLAKIVRNLGPICPKKKIRGFYSLFDENNKFCCHEKVI